MADPAFARIGTQPPGVYLYDASIDPNDLDHAVLGTLGTACSPRSTAAPPGSPVGLGAAATG